MGMDAELKAKWVKALRSGQYLQAAGVLCDEGTAFCCLGVLCDVQGAYWHETRSGQWKPILQSGRAAKSDTHPPREYRIGISDVAMGELVSMNDSRVCFSEIADYIEENL